MAKRIMKKLIAISLVSSIGYTIYKVMKGLANELCQEKPKKKK